MNRISSIFFVIFTLFFNLALFAQNSITAVFPTDKAKNVNIGILKWNGAENSVYDIYISTDQNPKLFIQEISAKELKNMIFELNSTYYWKVIEKKNGKQTAMSSVFSFSTMPIPLNKTKDYDYFIDSRDQKIYASVIIGRETWTAQNLDYDLNEKSWYYNNSDYNKVYGKLYLGSTVNENIDNLCPAGWHIPTLEEWNSAAEIFGGLKNCGPQFKESSELYWRKSDFVRSNESGLSLLPSGTRDRKPSFSNLGKYTQFWTSTPDEKGEGLLKAINFGFMRNYYTVETADSSWSYSVRCVQD
jgi:uncharacterized protein (TIGR02145 family)